MNKFLIIGALIAIVLTVGLAYTSAQVNIGEDPTDVTGVVIPTPPPVIFNNNTETVNASELWITIEGIMDNVVDLFPTFISAGFLNTQQHDQALNVSSNVTFDVLNITEMIQLNGTLDIEHTARGNDEHAIEIDIDTGLFGDIKAIFIDYITGAIVDGEDEEAIFINVNQFAAVGGDIIAVEVVTTEGGANVTGLEVGVQVNPIEQLSGIFTDMDSALNNTNDVLTQFTTDGDDIPIFAFDNDFVTIGNDIKFEEIEWILDTVAGGAGINPAFYFSTGVGTWGEFVLADGTNGLRNTGVMIWLDSDIPGWMVGLNSEFLIRINRTQNNIPVVPIERLVQIASATEFFWNKDGEILVDGINLTGEGVNVNDNVNIDFGVGTDLRIYSDGSQGIVEGSTIYQTSSDLVGKFGTPVPTSGTRVETDLTTTGTANVFETIKYIWSPTFALSGEATVLDFTAIMDLKATTLGLIGAKFSGLYNGTSAGNIAGMAVLSIVGFENFTAGVANGNVDFTLYDTQISDGGVNNLNNHTVTYIGFNFSDDSVSGLDNGSSSFIPIYAPIGNSTLGNTNLSGHFTVEKLSSLERSSQTLVSDAITATSSYIILDTEGGAATDNLYTINGGTMGSLLILQSTSNARDIVIVDNEAGGNLELSNNYTLTNTRRRLTLLFDGSFWTELAESNN